MFELQQTAFGPYTKYTVRQPGTGNGFSLVPAAGANLLSLSFAGQNVLDGHQTPEELAEAKWGKSALLFPFPNRLDRGAYTWEGKAYQFPINNAAMENAIHGFVRSRAFEVESILLTKASASVVCALDYAGDLDFYPFPFRLSVGFSFFEDSGFLLEVSVENLHDAPIPIGFGWHPYFRLTPSADAHQMQLPDCAQVKINARMIPTGGTEPYDAFSGKAADVGATFLDNTFLCDDPEADYELLLAAEGRSLRVRASAAECPYFQVFTPPHRQSIALEPMTCNVDAFNNREGLIALEPGETQEWQMEIDCRQL